MKYLTGTHANLTGDDQIKIALRKIIAQNGVAEIKDIYPAIEKQMGGNRLSKQGKASLRFFINKVAVDAGLVLPYDKNNPGWHITVKGKDYVNYANDEKENVIDLETNLEEAIASNSARGLAFEEYILKLLKLIYPGYVWYHQGIHKKNERGLDFIGALLKSNNDASIHTIGVQVKYHQEKHTPTEVEWLKFLAGCFTNRIGLALFITTGSMSGEQMRQARESNVLVIQGVTELNRVAKQFNYEEFKLFGNNEKEIDNAN
jgi:hypothetical protein